MHAILSLGLTEKTKLSFSSSNSSFTECVRKHEIITVSSSFLANSNCNNPAYTDCSFTQVNRTSLTTSASFTSCTWTNCQANNGGGIYLKAGNTVTLTVTKGEFYSCTSFYRGGGIYLEGIKTVTIEETLFHTCTAAAHNNAGGGGVEIVSLQGAPSIKHTTFLFCNSGNDGGGMGMWECAKWQDTGIVSCRFLGCSATPATDNDGGSLIVCYSNAAIGCSNILFANSLSGFHGGAASCLTYYSSNFNSSIPFFSFCFFKDNSAAVGNDAFLDDWIPENPFLHSYSTTFSSRAIYVINNSVWNSTSAYQNKDNWFPHGSLSLVDSKEFKISTYIQSTPNKWKSAKFSKFVLMNGNVL